MRIRALIQNDVGHRDEAAADVEMMRAEGIERVKVATSKATAARIAADDKWLQNTHDAHKRCNIGLPF